MKYRLTDIIFLKPIPIFSKITDIWPDADILLTTDTAFPNLLTDIFADTLKYFG